MSVHPVLFCQFCCLQHSRMAFSATIRFRPLILAVVLVCISIFCCNIGKSDDEEVPQTGTGITGYDPFTGTGVIGDEPHSDTGAGTVGDDPAQIVAKALLCFNEKQIYSSCEEAYRLTQSGYLNVPPEYVDAYCSGPCLAETNLVLNCIDHIMANFLFYNKATLHDVRDTIKAGCSYGPDRGDFNVAEHLQDEEDSAYKIKIQIFFGLGLAIMGHALLL